jgi:hypothetical protein
MRQELDEALCRDFPKLYAQRSQPMSHTAMCWGFDVGDGWEPIIRALSSQIEAYNNTVPIDHAVEATQVKEKFGGLRFYTTSAPDSVYEYIRKAEEQADTTCETCGGPGTLRQGRWWYTACDRHLRSG